MEDGPCRDDPALLVAIKAVVQGEEAKDGLGMTERVSLLIAAARGALDLRPAQLRVVGTLSLPSVLGGLS